jgi:16S rRNA (cytosine1402-N4)-methyltransferase
VLTRREASGSTHQISTHCTFYDNIVSTHHTPLQPAPIVTLTCDMTASTHIPVLAGELLDLLDPRPGQTVIDCTFGGGGHAQLIAERLGPEGTLIAIDRDPYAAERFEEMASEVACTVRFIRAGYAQALAELSEEGVRADGVYFDLGMSSMQVDARERGFSYSYDAPLDMRMDPDQELTAREILATWDERRLARTLRDFGEERHAGAIARAIVRRRERSGPDSIQSTQELVQTIVSALPAPARFAGGHPAKRSFQALRIAVNDELEQLEQALPLAWGLLREGGVLAGISFQSLEDRRVKRFLAERARGCVCPPDLPVCACGREPEAALLNRRSIVPSAGEIASNPRSSSARLRAARKLSERAETRGPGAEGSRPGDRPFPKSSSRRAVRRRGHGGAG